MRSFLQAILLSTFLYASQAYGFDWSGLYVGINGSYVTGHSHTRLNIPQGFPNSYFVAESFGQVSGAGSMNLWAHRFTGGGQVGYNMRFPNRALMLGIETDFGSFCLRKIRAVSQPYIAVPEVNFFIQEQIRTNWLYTLRLRLCYPYKRSLTFITGGLALTDFTFKQLFFDNNFSVFDPTFPDIDFHTHRRGIRAGWIIGAGFEYALFRRLSLCLSYMHVRFPRMFNSGQLFVDFFGVDIRTNTFNYSADLSANIFRVGLNWRL